jgi:hypothetical protein
MVSPFQAQFIPSLIDMVLFKVLFLQGVHLVFAYTFFYYVIFFLYCLLVANILFKHLFGFSLIPPQSSNKISLAVTK